MPKKLLTNLSRHAALGRQLIFLSKYEADVNHKPNDILIWSGHELAADRFD